jgi:hypothetical protein
MASLRSSLTSVLGRWLVVALVGVSALPSLVDFHVLGSSHGDAHDLLGDPGYGQLQRTAAGCGDDDGVHVEAGDDTVVPRCPACLLRSHVSPAPFLGALARLPVSRSQKFAVLPQVPESLSAASQSSRGPPRA